MNNSNPTISIIIPVYNTEKYLRRCLDSIVAQTYRDFECILVDDGSTDDSGKICDEYAAKDERFKVFHKKNGGASSARNFGLDNSKGNYIAFCDSDDSTDKSWLEIFAKNMNDSDLVISSFNSFKDGSYCNETIYDYPVTNGALGWSLLEIRGGRIPLEQMF